MSPSSAASGAVGEHPPDLLPPGTPVDLDNCAREPIRTPGAIQPDSAVLVGAGEDLRVVQTSTNIADFLGVGPVDVLGRPLGELLGQPAIDRLTATPVGAGRGTVCAVELPGGAYDAVVFASDPRLVAVELQDGYPAQDEARLAGRLPEWIRLLQSGGSVEGVLQAAVTILRDLTGFDRAWAYRFAADGHGCIVAEDREEGIESFLGLHFPEGDIPSQARQLYLEGGVRVIADAAAAPVALEPLVNPVTGGWLDLSACAARAVSPMHVRYLANMGVRASLSLPVVVDGKLWGLLSAHHYSKPRRLPVAHRAACDLLGLVCAVHVTAAAQVADATAQAQVDQAVVKVLESVATSHSVAQGLAATPTALLAVCGAAGAIVDIAGERILVGEAPRGEDAGRILAALQSGDGEEIVRSETLPADHPELADLAQRASGVLGFPLSRSQGNWVLWLRPEQPYEVTWGNRDKQLVRREPGGRLELGQRESFERWVEQVSGRCRPWTDAEVAAVRAVRSSLGTLLIARNEEMARANAELARANAELDSFAHTAAHDLREPLRGISQYAGALLEDVPDDLPETQRLHLERIWSLSGRMSELLAALLDYARIGRAELDRERLDLAEVMRGVTDTLAPQLAGSGAVVEVSDATFSADPTSVHFLLANLVGNAIKYSDGIPHVEVGVVPLSVAEAGVRRVRRSLRGEEAPPVLFVRDHGIGIEPRYQGEIFELFRRLHRRDERGGGTGSGLTLCRRTVERHGGSMWVVSTPGEGSTFYLTLQPY